MSGKESRKSFFIIQDCGDRIRNGSSRIGRRRIYPSLGGGALGCAATGHEMDEIAKMGHPYPDRSLGEIAVSHPAAALVGIERAVGLVEEECPPVSHLLALWMFVEISVWQIETT